MRRPAFADHGLVAGATGVLWGATEGAFVGPGAAVCGAIALGLLALVWSPVQALLSAFLAPLFAPALSQIERLHALELEQRRPLHRAYAAAGVLAIASLAGAVVLRLAFASLWAKAEIEAAQTIALYLVLALCVGCVALAVVVAPLLAPLVRKLDRRLGLPWPRSALLRYAVIPGLPGAAAIRLLLDQRDDLGVYTAFFLLPVAVVAQGLVALAIPRSPRRRLAALGLSLAIVLAAILGGSMKAWSQIRPWSLSAASTRILRAATDVDGDGDSSLFGGRDCAAFDGTRGVGAREIPDNGVDEDCDGADAQTDGVDAIDWPRYADALPPERIGHYNILLIIVDAMRADRVGFLGYERKNTPYLERLATESLVFTNAFAQAPGTTISIPSIFAGRNPGSMTWRRGSRPTPARKEILFSERVAEAGYRTGFVNTRYFDRHLKALYSGFDWTADSWIDIDGAPAQGNATMRSAALSLRELARATNDPASAPPFFVVSYLVAPHSPYLQHDEGFVDYGKSDLDRYDQEIAFADRAIGFQLEFLRTYPEVWDRTIVVVLSDHGEEFGEHDGVKHARRCYRESTHVPLLIRIPGIAGAVYTDPVGLVDVVPTLIELLGLPRRGELDGQSLLVPALARSSLVAGRPLLCSMVNQDARAEPFFRRSIRVGDYAYLENIVAGTYELYDQRSDPEEQVNLIDEPAHAATAQSLAARLRATLTGNLAPL